MDFEAISKFIRENGAFGVLVVLIFAAGYWGLPYVFRRMKETQEQHETRIDKTNELHRAQINEVVGKFDNRLADISGQMTKAIDANTNAIVEVSRRVERVEQVVEAHQK